MASSNYVLNELLDAPFDRLHPLKRNRPAAAGQVHMGWAWVQWLGLFAAGLAVGAPLGWLFVLTMAALWVMGCVYNIPPLRAKDIPFIDVLAEAVNNPIRFLAGWHMTGTAAVPIASLVFSYWMVGCYFMAIKRFAECRDLRSQASRARLEMALAFPFVAVAMAAYFALAFKPDSAAQLPEGLLREPLLMAAVVVCAAAMGLLLFADIPELHQMFPPTRVY